MLNEIYLYFLKLKYGKYSTIGVLFGFITRKKYCKLDRSAASIWLILNTVLCNWYCVVHFCCSSINLYSLGEKLTILETFCFAENKRSDLYGTHDVDARSSPDRSREIHNFDLLGYLFWLYLSIYLEHYCLFVRV